MYFPRGQTDRIFPHFMRRFGNSQVRLIGCPDMGCGLRGLLRAPSSPLHLPLASLPVSTSMAPPTTTILTQVWPDAVVPQSGVPPDDYFTIPWSELNTIPQCLVPQYFWSGVAPRYHRSTYYHGPEFEDAVTRPVAGAAQFPG